MFRDLISECRVSLSEEGEENQPVKAPRKHKHERASEKVAHLLSAPIEGMSRKKLLKLIPHLMHHFEKGHGSGEGDYRTVDADELATLGRHAERISAHAHGVKRMPGPVHHLSSHLCNHVANAHDRMSKYWADNGNEEEAELHGNESAKFRAAHKEHGKKARRHGYGY